MAALAAFVALDGRVIRELLEACQDTSPDAFGQSFGKGIGVVWNKHTDHEAMCKSLRFILSQGVGSKSFAEAYAHGGSVGGREPARHWQYSWHACGPSVCWQDIDPITRCRPNALAIHDMLSIHVGVHVATNLHGSLLLGVLSKLIYVTLSHPDVFSDAFITSRVQAAQSCSVIGSPGDIVCIAP